MAPIVKVFGRQVLGLICFQNKKKWRSFGIGLVFRSSIGGLIIIPLKGETS